MRTISGGMTFSVALLCTIVGNSAQASPINVAWSNLLEGEFNTTATDLSRTLDDFTVSARGYRSVAPIGGGPDTVQGPLPMIDLADCANVSPSRCPGGLTNGFRIQKAGLGIPQRFHGPSAPDAALGLNGYPDFDVSGNSITEFVSFSFSSAVDIGSIVVDDVSNFGRGIWFASSDSVADFSNGLGAVLSGFDLVNSPDTATDGLLSHTANLTDITTLIVGAPFITGDFFGIESGNSNFYINSFGDVSLSDTGGINPDPDPVPPTATVPGPATLPLMLMGLLGVFVSRLKKRLSV